MKNKNAVIMAIIFPLVAVVLVGIILLSVFGFKLFWSIPDLSFPYDAALANGYTGSEADFLSEQDTPSTRERQCYEAALASGEFSGSYLEFLQQFEQSDDAVEKAMSSVVCVGSTGAGVIYSRDGDGKAYIIAYDYNDRGSTAVTFSDGTKGTAQYSYTYSFNVSGYRLAVYVANSVPSSASVAKIADSDSVCAGERVYAIGNALANSASADGALSVTAGVVSVPEEYLSAGLPEIRVDAQIDDGKFGGGVFNARGELIGIVNISRETTSDINKTVLNGFGYAIPSNFIYSRLSATPGLASQVVAPETGESESEIIQGVLASSVVCIKSTTRAGFAGSYESMGAGVIYSLNDTGTAYILTNYHVVHGKTGAANTISVYLYGDYQTNPIPATFYGGVMSYDLAVLKITNSEVLKNSSASAVKIADSDSLTLGERVYALGNPNGEGFSVTKGIVSVTEEYINVARADEKADIIVPAIRTDAALNHGNSGGGLFNARGELVGITNARSETSGDGETVLYGFGYAIPSTFARAVAENVISGNGTAHVAKIVEKVSTHDSKGVYDEKTCKYYIEEKLVVDILGLDAGSIAGIRRNDTLLSASIVRGGVKTTVQFTRLSKYMTLLFELREGDILTFTCSRNGNEKPVLMTISLSETDFKTII